MLNIFITSTAFDAVPQRATSGSAGYDLTAAESVTIDPNSRAIISTGIFLELPTNFEGQIRSRSGLAAKHGVFVLNSPGTIDSDYRGEIKVILFNSGTQSFTVNKGDRIAQIVFAAVFPARFIPQVQPSSTQRGDGGFGSTGTH